uniref:Uncharacterized protein n=1 Tax=viral metagenome TaxID=1070528 RepID=A0A6H1ZAS6_9ZZZZ
MKKIYIYLICFILLLMAGDADAYLATRNMVYGTIDAGNTLGSAEIEDDTFDVNIGATSYTFPTSGEFIVVVYDASCNHPAACSNRELIRIKSVAGSSNPYTLTIKARSAEEPACSSCTFTSGANVALIMTAGLLTEMQDSITAGLTDIPASSLNQITSFVDEKCIKYQATGDGFETTECGVPPAIGGTFTNLLEGAIIFGGSGGGTSAQDATNFYWNAGLYKLHVKNLEAEVIESTGTDPKLTVLNPGGPASLEDGDVWWDSDIDAVGGSDGSVRYYARPTKLKTCAGNCSPAATEFDAMIWVTATGKVSLPAVAANLYGASVCVYSTTAAAVRVDVDAADRIVLNGLALDDGDCILSASVAGNFICLIVDSVAGWTTLGRSGAWTDDGVN